MTKARDYEQELKSYAVERANAEDIIRVRL
jgi:hypothetical protein